MATACRELVLQAVKAKLAAIVDVAGVTVERDREEDVTDAELPFLALYEGDETAQDDMTGERGYDLQVDVEGIVEGETREAAVVAASALRAEVQQALLADATLGFAVGVRDVRELPEAPPARLIVEAAKPTAGFARSFVVMYATAEADPYTFV